MVFITKQYDRLILYEEVWKDPITIVAKRYGISDVALHKICNKLHIPQPARGYWAKIKAGAKNLKKTPLPNYKGPDKITINRYEDTELKRIQEKSDDLAFLDEEERQALQEVCSCIIFPEHVTKFHPLVTKADIDVSDQSYNRAKGIMDTLIRTLEELHYGVVIDDKNHGTFADIRGEKVKLRIKERYKQVKHELTPEELKQMQKGYLTFTPAYDFFPSGELTLMIDDYWAKQKNWNDGKNRKVEELLGEFIIHLVQTSEILRVKHEEARLEEIRRQKAELRRYELEKLRREEEEKYKELEEAALDWNKAQIIRNFIDAVENNLKKSIEKPVELLDWINWAREKADWLDPLTAKKDFAMGARYSRFLLDGTDKEEEN